MPKILSKVFLIEQIPSLGEKMHIKGVHYIVEINLALVSG